MLREIAVSENHTKFYIDGEWVAPVTPRLLDVINPVTEGVCAQASMGSSADVDRAVAAARRAVHQYSHSSVAERVSLMRRIVAGCEARVDDLAKAVTLEIGSPIRYSHDVQTVRMIRNIEGMISVLENYGFEHFMEGTLIRREPIGVCALISPWNWPLASFGTKFAAALAAGCASIFKPSEFSPLSALVMAEILHDAGVPKGVFNLINGEGSTVGDALARHPGIDMISFTGSVRAGVMVAQAAAETVKRVVQELGGKSANVILSGTNLERTVPSGILRCFTNTGQSCQAPSRMLLHKSQRDAAIALAERTVQAIKIGDPLDPSTTMGPLANRVQFERVQGLIEKGLQEGATLLCGGPGRPEGFDSGYFVRPTIFADVMPDMTIAKEEIFGPVLSMMTYDTDEDAIEIANGTIYGLAGYVQADDIERGRQVAAKLQAGRIYFNDTPTLDSPAERNAPFGGYKRSGNGRQQGVFGLEEYLEVKAVLGYKSAEVVAAK